MDNRRFAFDDPWFDPEEKFPEFMAELAVRYPSYSLVYDRRRRQWMVYSKVRPDEFKAIVYVETAEHLPAEPDLAFLDTLTMTDVLREYGSVAAYCDWLEREQERRDKEGLEKMREDMRYAGKPVRDWIDGGGRETVILRPLSDEHRRQIEVDLNASAAARTIHREVA